MKIEELVSQLGIYKEEVNVLIQVKGLGPKGVVIRFPIKEIIPHWEYGYVALVANEQGEKKKGE